jgi:hypothetical protein
LQRLSSMAKVSVDRTGARVPALFAVPDGRTREGVIWVQNWGSRTRTELIWISFLVCWGLALGSLLIPIANLFLAPSLVILAPIVAFLVLREPAAVLEGVGHCPRCESEVRIGRAPLKFPLDEHCSSCGAYMQVTPRSERIPETALFEKEAS